jgi:serine/threonine protein kinase/Flp pilus assembly protein TadD
MSETNQLQLCDRCGAVLSGFGADRLCAACLLESALLEPTTPAGARASAPPLLAFNDYELLEEIARGGMGVVYRARQIRLNRPVAVKMILGGHLANADEVQRFRAEAETAAQLHHPNIVAIHEVGDHEGQPFFSMELVAGRNLAHVARDEPLPLRKAAAWLKTIAEAVQYAHSRGVLHRDLKPSNILIDENDQPRITDFGLAKRLEGDASLTITGQVLGSPSFIPPEQAAGQKDAMGPTSDVYSLGAILYHLLTGRPPFVAETLPQTLRMVTESEPLSPRLLNASVPRDLETICLKCLEKNPGRRYSTAQELADELGRFLRGEPTQTRPTSQAEKAWRWCRRKPALATALLLVLVVAVGSPIAAFLINQERHQAAVNAKKAQSEVQRSTQVAKFLRETLRSAGPSVSRGRDATLFREMLEARSRQVSKEIEGQPEVQGYIYLTIGSAFLDIGDHQRAITNLELAVRSYRLAQVGDYPNLAHAMSLLGNCQSFTGDITNGNRNARLGLEMARRCDDKEMLFICLLYYATSFRAWGGIPRTAGPFLQEALDLKKQLGNDPVGLGTVIGFLSVCKTNNDEIEQLNRDSLEILRTNLPPEHPKIVQATFNLGQALLNGGKFEEAERVLREAQQGFHNVHAPNHPYQAIVLRFYIESLFAQGKDEQAAAVVREQLDKAPTNASYLDLSNRVAIFRASWPPAPATRKFLRGDFLLGEPATLFGRIEDPAEAEALVRENFETKKKSSGYAHHETDIALDNVMTVLKSQGKLVLLESILSTETANLLQSGEQTTQGGSNLLAKMESARMDVLVRLGRWDEARAAIEKALTEESNTNSLPFADRLNGFANQLRELKKYDDAAALGEQALKIQLRLAGTNLSLLIETYGGLAATLDVAGKYSNAAPLLEQRLELIRRLNGTEDLKVADALSWNAWIYYKVKRFPDEESALEERLAIQKKHFGAGHTNLLETLDRLAANLETQHESKKLLAVRQARSKIQPPDTQPSLTESCLALLKRGNFSEAESLLEGRAAPLVVQGDIYARAGLWKEAGAKFSQSINSAPDNWLAYVHLAPILLFQGDADGYGRLCRQAATHFLSTNDAGTADNFAKACSLDPRAGVKLDTVAEAAETAVTLGKDSEFFPWFALCKSMAEYRQRHFAVATNWAQKSLAAAGQIPERDAAAYLMLAMAQTELNQTTAARNSFEKGCDIVERKLPRLDSKDLGNLWHDGLIARLLLREARILIKETSEPVTDPAKAPRP